MVKYDIWNKFNSKLVYDEKYIKAEVKTFNGIVNTIFWNDEIPKENVHYTCIAAVSIDFVMNIDKNTQFYLEEWKDELKRKKMTRCIDVELDLYDCDDFNYE